MLNWQTKSMKLNTTSRTKTIIFFLLYCILISNMTELILLCDLMLTQIYICSLFLIFFFLIFSDIAAIVQNVSWLWIVYCKIFAMFIQFHFLCKYRIFLYAVFCSWIIDQALLIVHVFSRSKVIKNKLIRQLIKI